MRYLVALFQDRIQKIAGLLGLTILPSPMGTYIRQSEILSK
jgi:hypothetical protein